MERGIGMVEKVRYNERLEEKLKEIFAGGTRNIMKRLKEQNKLFVRDRLELFLMMGNIRKMVVLLITKREILPADGVVTAMGKVDGQTVCVMANDSTVKAGSWGAHTVEKIIRIQEIAEKNRVPMLYLVDSAGARITDQLDMFPNRRGAGKNIS